MQKSWSKRQTLWCRSRRLLWLLEVFFGREKQKTKDGMYDADEDLGAG